MKRLYLPQGIADDILEHAWAALPNECVGLLFGCGDEVERRVPLTNVAESSTRYFAAPAELFAALQEAEAKSDKLLAIYHSHPNGRQMPSEMDIEEAYYSVVHLIAVPQSAVVRAFDLDEKVREVDIIVRF